MTIINEKHRGTLQGMLQGLANWYFSAVVIVGAVILLIIDAAFGANSLAVYIQYGVPIGMGITLSPGVIAWFISISLVAIQAVLWMRVLDDDKVSLDDTPWVVAAVAVAVVDTYFDVAAASLYRFGHDASLFTHDFMGAWNSGEVTFIFLVILFAILGGFNEILVAGMGNILGNLPLGHTPRRRRTKKPAVTASRPLYNKVEM